MCVYSCVKTSRSQSSVFAIVLSPLGSGGADLDQVVRDGRGPPVWQVALVHQHNVHAPGCWPERPIERRRDILGYQREPARSFLLTLMKVDVEPWCRDRPESKAWVVSRGGEGRGGREHDQECQSHDQSRASCGPGGV